MAKIIKEIKDCALFVGGLFALAGLCFWYWLTNSEKSDEIDF